VPQCSVLGPLFFLLYVAEVFDVVTAHGATAHFYADDGQLYISSPASSAADTIARFAACFADVDAWMRVNRLRLNAGKTQLIWLDTRQQLDKLPAGDDQLLSASIHAQSVVRDLCVTLDSQLTMADHVTAVCRAGYYQLRQLRVQIIQSLTPTVAQSLVLAFISCRLDYCNSLLYVIADCQLRRLQSVQNTAARLITGT